MEDSKWIKWIYVTAGLVNTVGILLFSKLLTNDYLTQIDPTAFSKVGLLTVMLWGLAYWSITNKYQKTPMTNLAFAIEKFFYLGLWILWMKGHSSELGVIFANDALTAMFYAVYGIVDGSYGVLFFYVFMKYRNAKG
jgi:hypothetical protein